MKHRVLEERDLYTYFQDLYECYEDNPFIFDEQNDYKPRTVNEVAHFVSGFIKANDSLVVGILDDEERFLYGIILFDKVRSVDLTVAEVHIAIRRELRGPILRKIFQEVLDYGFIDAMYCEIPQIACKAIGVCKRLGFKKTGYIPKVLPYTNSKGEIKLYDVNIFYRERERKLMGDNNA